MQEEVPPTLKSAWTRLGSVCAEDRDAIVSLGLALEEAMSDAPADAGGLRDLAELCLEGLQMLYEGTSPDAGRLAAALSSTAYTCEHYFGVEDGPTRDALLGTAGQALWLALGRDPADCPYRTDNDSSEQDATLDDAAALLMQLNPADQEGLTRLNEMLDKLSINDVIPQSVRAFASQGIAKVQSVIDGQADAPETVLEEVGALLQCAADEMDEPLDQAGADEAPRAPVTTEPVCVDDEADEDSPADPTATSLPPDVDVSLVGEFVTECREYIQNSEAALLSLETNPSDMEALNTVFRAFHTIKGNAAALGFTEMSTLAHRAETMLSRMRDGEIHCIGGYADLALRSADMLGELIQAVEDALAGDPLVKPAALDDLINTLVDPEAAGISEESEETSDTPRLGDILVAEGKAERDKIEALAADSGGLPLGEAAVKSKAASAGAVAKALRTQQKLTGNEHAVESSVRVRTDRLDKMIDTIGELVIAQSMVAQDETMGMDGLGDLAKKVIHLGKIVRELQHMGMSMRMVPLKPTFQKMTRLARDVARKSGKVVEFVTIGDDTEIDRNMVDVIGDPLVHMVRNAVDHGIEPPDTRVTNGKPKSGRVELRAFHSGGNVVVELHDDGKGLERDKIVAKAISKGLIESDKGLSDSEVFNLVFEPGFSTAEKVTDMSGRGVGLDVVRRGVEALRGRIEISSEPGKGSVFSLQLPLTMAVTDGMQVRVGEERFILPTVNIRVSFRPSRDDLYSVVGQAELVMLRGEPMPLVRLHRLFDIDSAVVDPTQGLLVVMEGADRPYALLVDELLGQQHVVAKSLGDGIGKVKGVSGGAILGDGRVGLILDPREIAAVARQMPVYLECREMKSGLAA